MAADLAELVKAGNYAHDIAALTRRRYVVRWRAGRWTVDQSLDNALLPRCRSTYRRQQCRLADGHLLTDHRDARDVRWPAHSPAPGGMVARRE